MSPYRPTGPSISQQTLEEQSLYMCRRDSREQIRQIRVHDFRVFFVGFWWFLLHSARRISLGFRIWRHQNCAVTTCMSWNSTIYLYSLQWRRQYPICNTYMVGCCIHDLLRCSTVKLQQLLLDSRLLAQTLLRDIVFLKFYDVTCHLISWSRCSDCSCCWK